jgi:diguanylate cyclase (GGDEF)-like protein
LLLNGCIGDYGDTVWEEEWAITGIQDLKSQISDFNRPPQDHGRGNPIDNSRFNRHVRKVDNPRVTTELSPMLLQAGAAALLVLGTGTYVTIHVRRKWTRPMKRLLELLPQIREGEAPIEELGEIKGGLTPLIDELRAVFDELRRQKGEVAQLEHEMRQRVANRTLALERSLGAIKQQAAKDSLTGLLNRRMLDEYLPQLVEKSRDDASPMTVMMIDVDDFKLLNDTLGHAAGDEFLRSLGQLIRSTLRETDFAFRYGGDEFVLVLPEADKAHAEPLSARLSSLVDGITRTLKVPRPPRLSIGMLEVWTLPPATPANEILAQADRLLYEMKVERKRKRAVAARVA